MQYFAIPEENMPALEKKLNTIKKKCEAFGNPFSFEIVGSEYHKVKIEDGYFVNVKFINIEVEGTAIINDWKLLGMLEHTPIGNNVHSFSSDLIPSEYYNLPPFCAHCNRKNLKKSFLIKNTNTNEIKQVGSSCLKNYTGISAERAASIASIYQTIQDQSNFTFSQKTQNYFQIEEVLIYSAEMIRCFGFQKSTAWNTNTFSTFQKVLICLSKKYNYRIHFSNEEISTFFEQLKKVHFNSENKDSISKAKESLKWIENQESTNEYIQNLKIACKNNFITQKQLPIVVSLIQTFNKSIQKANEQKEQNKSQFVGEIKQRISIEVKSFKRLCSYTTRFGICYVYQFIDENNNIYIWKTSKYIEDDIYFIIGTVKNHSEYKNIKQTEITRCKYETIK